MAGNRVTIGELVYEIRADVAGFGARLKEAESQVKNLTVAINKQSSEQSKSVFKGVAAWDVLKNTISGAFSTLKNFAATAIKEAQNQQVVTAKLANNLQNVIGARKGDYEALIAQSQALKRKTAIDDAEIVNSQALLATFQLNGDAIQRLIPRILDMGAANAETGELTANLQGATMAVGKAFTSGVGILSRYGVAMTEAQKKAFELADEQGKLNILTEVLDDNFKGAAEAVGQTFAGRVARARNAIGDIYEDIGFALIPTIESLVGQVTTAAEGFAGNQDRVNQWGKAIFQGTNFAIAIAKAIKLVVEWLTALGDRLFSVGKVAFSFASDIATNFKNIGTLLKSVMGGIGQALKGDFEGAAKTFKNSLNNVVVTNTLAALDEMEIKTKSWQSVLNESFNSVGESMRRAVDAEGYRPVSEAAVKAYRAMGDGAKGAAKTTKENAKATQDDLKDLAQKYDDLRQRGSDALVELENATNEKLKGIDDRVKDLKKSLEDLNKEFSRSTADENRAIAERFVEEEQAIAELEKRRAETTDSDRLRELENEINQRRRALMAARDLETMFGAEISEARRRASLTDFERDVEDAVRRKEQLKAEFEEKKLQIEEEIRLQEEARTKTVELYQAKQAEINDIIAKSNAQFQAFSEERVNITRREVNQQIEDYNRLASAIARAKSAQTTKLLDEKPQFAVGGFVGSQGGEVHPGEYVIPAPMVKSLQGLVSQLEAARTGRSVTTNRTVNAPVSINARIEGQADMAAIAREMAWQLGKL